MRTRADLDRWLADHDDFADARVAAVEVADGRVTLHLLRTVVDGRVPGAPRCVEVHELVAVDPVEFVRPHDHAPDHHIEGLTLGEVDLSVEAFVPGRLYLAAGSFLARRVGAEWTTVPPHVVEHEFTVLAAPDGGYWTERVGALLGTEVVWRAYGSGARAPGQDPDGCFLRTAAALDTTIGGVWCNRGAGTTRFTRRDADAELWRAVRVAAGVGGVRTGNCVFGREDWLRYVDTGALPPVERLVSGPPG